MSDSMHVSPNEPPSTRASVFVVVGIVLESRASSSPSGLFLETTDAVMYLSDSLHSFETEFELEKEFVDRFDFERDQPLDASLDGRQQMLVEDLEEPIFEEPIFEMLSTLILGFRNRRLPW